MRRVLFALAALLWGAGIANAQLMLNVGGRVGNGLVNLTTPIMSMINSMPASGTATQFGGTTSTTQIGGNSIATTSTTRRVPLPFMGAISNLRAHLTIANAGLTITNHLGSLGLGTVTCNTSGGANQDCISAASQTVNAGTLFQWQFATTVTWNSPLVQMGFTYTSNNGQHAALLGQVGSSGAAAGPVFYGIYSSLQNATENIVASIFCSACGGIIHGFYWIPNATETAGSSHDLAVVINGIPLTTSMHCADAAGGSTGCCVNDRATLGTIDNVIACQTVAPVTVFAGDSISIKATCAGGTCGSSIFPGFGIDFTPTNQGVVPALTIASGTGGPAWTGLQDTNMATTQFNYQMAPVNMTVSNYGFCSLTAFTGTSVYTITGQSGATGALPTTPVNPPQVALSSAIPACPGANGYAQGANDITGHTLALIAGQSVDTLITRAGSVLSTPMKLSAAMTVP